VRGMWDTEQKKVESTPNGEEGLDAAQRNGEIIKFFLKKWDWRLNGCPPPCGAYIDHDQILILVHATMLFLPAVVHCCL